MAVLFAEASSANDANTPVLSLDTEHGVAVRLLQELQALKRLAGEGEVVQAETDALVNIDFGELQAAVTIIEDALERAITRKYGTETAVLAPSRAHTVRQ